MAKRGGAALVALCSLALILSALAPARAGRGYATTISGAYFGSGVFAGKVKTAAEGEINGRSIRRRCATGRRIESSTHSGDASVKLRTTPKGRWRFSLPAEPGRQIKVFVLSKRLPDASYCTFGKVTIQVP